MRIAVTTPNGNVGRHVVAMLIRAGLRPAVLTRHPDGLPPWMLPEVDVKAVDLYDTRGVTEATQDVDALYWVDPTTGSEDPLGDYDRATTAVVRAVTENRIGRTVFQSSIGAERRHGAGEIDGLAATEFALDATGADVTHLRCGFFFTNLLFELDRIRAGRVPIILPPDRPMAWVAPRDIAEVAVGRLLSPAWSGRVVQAVHGPADLSWAQAADIAGEAIGRPFTAGRIPDDAMRESLRADGMTAGLTEAVIGMSVGLRDDFTPEQPRTVPTTTPTTLAAWAYTELRPLI